MASDPMSIVRSSSVLESICDKLDEFAQSAANAVVSLGYDELTNEQGVFIVPESETAKGEQISAPSYAAQTATIAQIKRQLTETHERALSSARQILAQQAQSNRSRASNR